MADYNILKAVEYSKTSAAWRKTHAFDELLTLGWWLQPKYDGCFGMAVIKPDHTESRMLSRTGEDYTKSCQHILDEIRQCCEETGTWPMDDGFVVLGEVWHPTDKFPKISGDFRRQRPSPHLCFVANDLLPLKLVTPIVYFQRWDDLFELVGARVDQLDEVTKVCVVDVTRFNESPTGYAQWLKEQGGYDGAILRDPGASYTIGDAKLGQIIKVKPVLSLDLRCNGVIAGEGKHEGRLGAITVSYNGVASAVGTGFTDEDRNFMWQGATRSSTGLFAPHNPIGKIVEIECMGLTEDGKLREPRFKGIRHDKLKAD